MRNAYLLLDVMLVGTAVGLIWAFPLSPPVPATRPLAAAPPAVATVPPPASDAASAAGPLTPELVRELADRNLFHPARMRRERLAARNTVAPLPEPAQASESFELFGLARLGADGVASIRVNASSLRVRLGAAPPASTASTARLYRLGDPVGAGGHVLRFVGTDHVILEKNGTRHELRIDRHGATYRRTPSPTAHLTTPELDEDAEDGDGPSSSQPERRHR